MRFMIIRKADPETEAGVLPSEQLIRDMMNYNQSLLDAGLLRGGDGLQPTAKGARVTFSDGTPTVIDGPFTETKELIAGFTMVEADSLAEVIEWAKRWPKIDGHGNVQLEIRQLFEEDDFGEAFTPELREAERKMGEKL